MTYSELVQQVKDYLETDETTFNANIDTFIKLAEEDICRRVQVPVFRKNATSALTISDPYLSLPADYLAVYEVAISIAGSYKYLVRKDTSFIRECYAPPATLGTPKYYAIFDQDSLILGPTPSAALVVELHYYAQPTSIVDDTVTWLGDNAQNALLWGAVLQGYAFLKGSPDLMAVYKGAYDQAVSNLSTLGEGLNSKDSYKDGQRRIPA